MLIAVPPKRSVSQAMRYLEGRISQMISDRFARMKYRYGSRRFRRGGYYADATWRNQKRIEKHIRNQPR